MSNLDSLTQKIVAFRDARDWKQFHNPKDLALSLVLESAELLEKFQWRQGEAISAVVVNQKTEIADELSDILYYTLLIAHDLEIDLPTALAAKLQQNEEKYPVDKARGSSKKYTEL